MHRYRGTALAVLCGLLAWWPAQGATFKVIYNFQGGTTDGANPQAGLLLDGHTLYGTTLAGGRANFGTVFAIDLKTGAESLLHSFVGEGAAPTSGLLKLDHTLYGTATSAGAYGQGIVYAFDLPSGAERVVYAFQGGSADGGFPQGGLISLGGMLYGTTLQGGSAACSFGCGTVFRLDPASGGETILHFFQGGDDGANPYAGLVAIGHKLYGTTGSGGAGDAGTVFGLNAGNGKETPLHYFDKQGDGTNPISGLTFVNNLLYGTTVAGGAGDPGLGVVYSIDPATNAEAVVHDFIGRDGALPEANVVALGGKLVGTTSIGGKPNDGVVYALDIASGKIKVLHAFQGSDGATPWAPLLRVGATLYGTTSTGGSTGAGVVFSITP
jgi:uncharacterized repeat protein (TIGR03803 family)